MKLESTIPVQEIGNIDKIPSNWIEKTKDKYASKLRQFSMRTLIFLASIAFLQKEAESMGGDLGYDFKKYLMIGLNHKNKQDKESLIQESNSLDKIHV